MSRDGKYYKTRLRKSTQDTEKYKKESKYLKQQVNEYKSILDNRNKLKQIIDTEITNNRHTKSNNEKSRKHHKHHPFIATGYFFIFLLICFAWSSAVSYLTNLPNWMPIYNNSSYDSNLIDGIITSITFFFPIYYPKVIKSNLLRKHWKITCFIAIMISILIIYLSGQFNDFIDFIGSIMSRYI